MNIKHKKFLKFLFLKLPIFFGIFILIMIGALKLAERYPDPLREGLQEHISKASGTNATIGKLERISFVPNAEIILHDLTMHDKSNTAIVNLKVDDFTLGVPLLSMLTRGNRLMNFNIKNLDAIEGQITPLALKIASAMIEDRQGPEQYGSFIIVKGQYDGKKMSLEAEIEKLKTGYRIPDDVSFSLSVGNSTLNGVYAKGFSTVNLKSSVYKKGNKQSQATNYLFVKSGEYNKNNPLSCLLYNGESTQCDVYLENKDN